VQWRLRFWHRIGLLVALAGVALMTVTAVTLVLGRRSAYELSGIETRYVPLIELNRDLETTLARITRALEDAASAADESGLVEADKLGSDFTRRLGSGSQAIANNGDSPAALERDFNAYFMIARSVAESLVGGASASKLAAKIETMRHAQQTLAAHLEAATIPDRRRLAEAFANAHDSQESALRIESIVAAAALLLMVVLCWRITRQTVRALRSVSIGVERLAAGEFEQEIDVATSDEIGDVAREANRTAVRLREYRDRAQNLLTETQRQAEELARASQAEKERAEAAIQSLREQRAADAKFRGLLEAAPDAMVIVDSAGMIALVNVQAEKLFRYSREALLGQPVEMLIPERSRSAHPGHRGDYFNDPKARAMGSGLELFGRRNDGSEFAVEISLSPLETTDGVLVSSAIRDITARRQAERDLRHAKDVAETASRELEAFSYSVAHDLRAPLRGINGFSVALAEELGSGISGDAKDYLERIGAGAVRMGRLIDALLGLARVSRADLTREPIDLTKMAKDVITQLQVGDPARVVTWVVAQELVAYADPQLLRVLLENLLGNAWKFVSKCENARIEFGRSHNDGTFFVRDNGAGFDMAYVGKLFAAFQRLHSANEFAGTGIGLATVQRIIARHGGRIWADGAVNAGATFHFTLSEPYGAIA
jgi:PAS domain S-box-containing protein